MKQNKIKICTIDIETYPDTVLMYGPTHEPIIVKILEFGPILSCSFKMNDGTTKYIGLDTIKGYKLGDKDDRKLLIEISKILSGDIDYIGGQNIDNFDIPKITERLIFHRLPALPKVPTLDTYKLWRGVSKLQNNKLNTISQFAGVGGKVTHSGTELFVACGNGDKKSWKVNRKYNKKDVDLAWEDLKVILPYAKLPIPRDRGEEIICPSPTCGGKMIKSKVRRTVAGMKQQYQCNKCGRYHTPNKIIKNESK